MFSTMAPLVLEGDSLGSRHRHYNKLLMEAIANNQQPIKIDFDKCDIDNFLQIDIAGHNKNVEYILDVLRCEDMLYVTRAINKSTWLITDQQYAHIINPKHLHAQLFPLMTAKAISKLMLHIRLNIKDQKRAKDFYQYYLKVNPDAAVKWLPLCSLEYITHILNNRDNTITIPFQIIKKLGKISTGLLKVYISKYNHYSDTNLQGTTFLLKKHHEEYLDLIETLSSYHLPTFGKKPTKKLIVKSRQRIIQKFRHYMDYIDLPTFVKSFKKEDIPDFLEKNSKQAGMVSFDTLKHFLRRMDTDKSCIAPILKTIFDKTEYDTDDRNVSLAHMTLYHAIESIYTNNPPNASVYRWYEFAPFGVAFFDLKKLVYTETSPEERNSILELMITCAGKNKQHIHAVLQYYHDKHINVPYKYKIMFVNKFLGEVEIHTLDDKSWSLLNALFHSLEVYIESGNDVMYCVDAIILYKVTHNETVPEIVERKFIFDTLKNCLITLNKEDCEKMFTYLKNYLLKRLHETISNEKDLNEDVKLLGYLWSLLVDWKKEESHYQIVHQKIRTIIQIKRDMSWNIDLSDLYKTMKSWRKHLIEESLLLYPSDKVCMNALKYYPKLLTQYGVEVEAVCCNDKVSLTRFLNKLRIYWPHSLAEQWVDTYLNHLDQPEGHSALFKGIYILLPRTRLLSIIKKYAPEETKINWNDSNALEISLRKNIAKNMHMARPFLPSEVVLLYAKGDYLQFAVLSLYAIFHNRYSRHIQDHLQKYLDAPVSLQKHGLRLAFTKLKTTDLAPLLSDCWKTTKNPTIRTILFTSSFPALCKATKPSHIVIMWDLMKMFIGDLSCEENLEIYATLDRIKEVPMSIRADFYVKSYLLLKSLPEKANCRYTLDSVIKQACENMEILDPDFILNILLDPVAQKFSITEIYSNIIASFLLCSKDEETQMNRYNNVMTPVMEWFSPWDRKTCGRNYFVKLLECLHRSMSYYVFEKKMVLPLTMFADTYDKLVPISFVRNDYIELTAWELSVTLLKLLDKLMKSSEKEYTWNEICIEVTPLFAENCIQHFKEDMNKYFSSAYLLFEAALKKVLGQFGFKNEFRLNILEAMLKIDGTVETYLIVLRLLPKYAYGQGDKIQQIRNMIWDHPSEELKMHYYRAK